MYPVVDWVPVGRGEGKGGIQAQQKILKALTAWHMILHFPHIKDLARRKRPNRGERIQDDNGDLWILPIVMVSQ